ncbi:DinB family protein [Bacillus cereus]|uniref:DinB family protein n=1 Tax=Bacillus cereus TaxID=1396 RepID=UPI00330EDAB4|nr:DinB family protein [Bacillus cereus]
MTRGCFFRVVESVPKDIIHLQPSCFKNNIQWQVGHVLTISEQYIFEYPEKTMYIPGNYIEFFGEGTSPLSWTENVPDINELLRLLKEHRNRIRNIPSKKFDETFKRNVLGYTTFNDLASMLLLHEAYHLGQIYSISKLIKYGDLRT